ncbi:hypothetical protein Btru_011681 [Bulinus truncatus]|nr:hypothetical protein Btru_011681 [Bulinus truncatus]
MSVSYYTKKPQMYYTGLSTNSGPTISGQPVEKTGIYVPAPSPYAPAGYPPGQPGLAPRFAAAPQAYAVVSNTSPSGYTISPAFHSMPYTGLQGIPTSTHAYVSAAQYPGISYQTALGPRTGAPSHYPIQAGAPLIAASYSPMPGTMPGPAARAYPMGHMAAYPPGYPLPAGSAPIPYHGAATFGPPF